MSLYVNRSISLLEEGVFHSFSIQQSAFFTSFHFRDGQYGLYLDDSLFEGSSASCPTFDNEPLCSASIVGNMKTVKYECVGLEVWGMGS